ncbi:META domain-containing protein [Paracoccus laeviglucosivorans]|uniref:Putative lipoprotein n=1 Tax=Paracoccus laeviglucosivorans TaxID=1197861 RepID=A0A521EU51_9RHOB|nr:META domain-containing protein [Paracoccus laeviglucosivorans]SMO87429.1 putative lipoprotein [Paracoccus laeviglucosivorans]
MIGSRLAALTLAALSALPLTAMAAPQTISGTVTYRERMALPAGTETEVRLLDVSLADAPARTIAVQTITGAVASPIAYRLEYDDTGIVPRHSYALRAEITLDDALLFTTTTHIPAFGGATDIPVERVTPSPVPQSLPIGEWLAEDIQGGGVIDNLQSSLNIASDGAVSGNAGCNRFFGQAEIQGDGLTMQGLGSTRMLCAPAVMDQESKFMQALGATHGFRLMPEQGKLLLLDENGRTILLLARSG